KATIAIFILDKFCWLAMDPSRVRSTSKCSPGRARSLPFFNPAHPLRGTDWTSWPGRGFSSRQSRFSSSRILTSGVGVDFRFHFLEHGQHLRAFHAGETFQKIFNGIAGLEMIEEALHRDARALEDQRAAEDFRVGMVSAF